MRYALSERRRELERLPLRLAKRRCAASALGWPDSAEYNRDQQLASTERVIELGGRVLAIVQRA